jgi:polyribonucleotide nucleotidyltransferase
MQKKEFSTEVGDEKLIAEFNDLANQASGSVILRLGDTAVLATAVMGDESREGLNYFPLTVEYEEKFYATGQILGSRFMRREGKPSDGAVLSGRAVDRTLRPLFDQSIRHDVQVVITILSLGAYDPDVLAINAASLALATSDIPWNGPVSSVRVGIDGENFITNPNYSARKSSTLDLLACGKDGNISMVEVGAHEIQEDVLARALAHASKEIELIQAFQEEIIKEINKEKRVVETEHLSDTVKMLFAESIAGELSEYVFSGAGKEGIKTGLKKWSEIMKEKLPDENISLALEYMENEIDALLHTEAIKNNRRADGRAMDEVRELFAQAGGVSNIIHGTGIFYRGGTHIFSALTLGGPDDSQIIDGIEEQTKKRYMHHYNFPPFSVGETGRVGGFNRRMIGHGALAEKALEPVLPPVESFPYTIRVVSEALASNGSTSMGSVCGSTLALMDGGVPIKAPVAGIAMGLMMDASGAYKVLTDIQGPEDHHGDMDFKVAGTESGITAVQMDVKVSGVPIAILKEALEDAKKARLTILRTIHEAIAEPRASISPNAPKIMTMKIKPEQIGSVIGSGGKIINGIKDKTGAEISIEDDGSVFVIGKNESAEKALAMIEQIVHEYKAGERYEGEVVKILDFGAFVKIGHEADGLVHISEIAPFRIDKIEDALHVGEKVPVVVKEVDDRGRINLSIKLADPDFIKNKGIKESSDDKNVLPNTATNDERDIRRK